MFQILNQTKEEKVKMYMKCKKKKLAKMLAKRDMINQGKQTESYIYPPTTYIEPPMTVTFGSNMIFAGYKI